jgi:RNA polymerase sigma factor (sigma-70 family)
MSEPIVSAPESSAAPVAVPTSRISAVAAVALFAALTLFYCEIILKLAVLASVLSTLALVGAEAPLLRSVGALDPQVFEKALLFGTAQSLAVVTLASVWRSARWISSRYFRTPRLSAWSITWPTQAFISLLAFMWFVALPLDRAKIVDFDDGRLGSAIIGAAIFIGWFVGWAIARTGWWAVTGTWRVCRSRPVLTGMVIVAASGVALETWAIGEVAELLAQGARETSAFPLEKAFASDPVETTRQFLLQGREEGATPQATWTAALGPAAPSASSDVRGLGAPGTTADGDDPFGRCVNELHATPPAPSAVATARVGFGSDIVQDTIVNVCLHVVQRPVDDLRPYFFQSLHNALRAHRREEYARCRAVQWEECRLQPKASDDAATAAEHRAVERMLCQLSPEQSKVMWLSVFEGMNGPEIAEKLGISHAMARRHLSDARSKLRDIYQQQCQ